MKRRSRLCLLLLLPGSLLLAGCPNPSPWAGLTRAEFDQLEEHRLAGLAILENGGADVLPDHTQKLAAEEFREVIKLRPKLALPHLDLALALTRTTKPEEAVPEARKGVELAPKSAAAHMILAGVLDQSHYEEALKEAETAASLDPDNLRVLGFLLDRLRSSPGEHHQREYQLVDRLIELAPDNLVALSEALLRYPDRSNLDEVAAQLERLHSLLPRSSPEFKEVEVRLRRAINANKAADVTSGLRVLVNLLKADHADTRTETRMGSGLFSRDFAAVFGSKGNAADLAMTDWDIAPPSLPPSPTPVAVTWRDVTGERGLSEARVSGIAPVAVGDLDYRGDAGATAEGGYLRLLDRPDLATTGSPTGIFENSEKQFYEVEQVVAEIPASPLLADFNNDYSLDFLAVRADGDHLWRNRGSMRSGEGSSATKGRIITPASASNLVEAPKLPTRGPGTATVADLDIDGDLDILRLHASSDGLGLTYLRNNGNLTFTDRTAAAGLTFPAARARQAVCADFDADGDPDVFVVRAGGSCLLFSNLRQERFRDDTLERLPRCREGGRAAVVGDWDRDGDWDIAVAGVAPHGSRLLRNQNGKFTDEPLFPESASLQAEWIETLDFDNDTWPDLATAGPDGVQLWRNDHGVFHAAAVTSKRPCTWVSALDYDRDRDPDLLAATRDGKLILLENEGGEANGGYEIELHSTFQHFDDGTSSFGTGSELSISTRDGVQKVLATAPATLVGLGGMKMPVSMRVKWPHSPPQNYFPREQGDAIALKQEVNTSCPFLYTWNGSEWKFATDFLWRSPLGMQFAPGVPIPHDQTRDWVRLTGDQLPSSDGDYQIAATEDLREVSYLDWVRLLAVDHPEGTEVYCDERFRLGKHPAFVLHTVRIPHQPIAAHDENGRDLLPALTAVDNRFTPVPDGRYRGITAPHDLVLDLGQAADLKRMTLYLNGWIYPANSSVYLAASQDPSIKIIPPRLSVGDGHGGWRVVADAVGIPCGKRKTIVLDLGGKLTLGDLRIKLTTTMEIRWDAAWFTSGESNVPTHSTTVPLADALLSERGVGRMYREVPDGPDLAWFDRVGSLDSLGWRPITGSYTRLGDCSPLLTGVDDRYVIFGPGDCIRMRFDGRALGPLLSGWKRTLFLMSDGWTKDSNPNTVSGEAVRPLPFHGMRRYPYAVDERFPNDAAHQLWQKEWNTRRKGDGRLE